MTAGLTPRQGQLVRFIRTYLADHDGVPPSFQEMGAVLMLKSKSGIGRMIDELEARGVIRRIAYAKRSISIVERELTLEPAVDYTLTLYCEATKADQRAVVEAAILEYIATHRLSAREELP